MNRVEYKARAARDTLRSLLCLCAKRCSNVSPHLLTASTAHQLLRFVFCLVFCICTNSLCVCVSMCCYLHCSLDVIKTQKGPWRVNLHLNRHTEVDALVEHHRCCCCCRYKRRIIIVRGVYGTVLLLLLQIAKRSCEESNEGTGGLAAQMRLRTPRQNVCGQLFGADIVINVG